MPLVSPDFGPDIASLACQITVKKVEKLPLACAIAVYRPVQSNQNLGQVMKRQKMAAPSVPLQIVNKVHDAPYRREGDFRKSVNSIFQRTHKVIGVIFE